MPHTYESFRKWKIEMARRDIARARAAIASGNRKNAAWYLYLAAIARKSITP